MKTNLRRSAVVAGLVLATAFSWGVPPAKDGAEVLVAKAEALIDALARNDFQAAAKDFDETMAKVSGPEKLAEFWKQLPAQLSPFKRRTASRRDTFSGYEIVLVTCEFEKQTLDVRVVFDKAGRIAGFQFVPSLPPARYEPPAYADPGRFVESETAVGKGTLSLPATLTLPRGYGPRWPALVLVHGSGPNDRNETIGPNRPFQDIAWGLASRGIAVLRYEKRTRVHGARMAADPRFSSFTVKEETVDDAVEAVKLLRGRPEIDPGRIFVLGHSLGGMLIPRIAAASGDLAAGFVIMAGLTRPIPETYLEQMTYILSLDGGLSDEDEKQLADIRAQVARINALQEADRASPERILNVGPAYWLDLRAYDPPRSALQMAKPLLLLQGSRDYQVTARDFENWKKTLAGRPGVEFKLYPKCNHLFFEGQGLPAPGEYTMIHGSVSPQVIEDIAAFVLASGSKGGRS